MGQVQFLDYFQEGAVRYDFDMVGDNVSIDIIHLQTKYLPEWGGNPNHLIDTMNYGTYRYSIFDVGTHELIFRKGFSPLYWEWQLTAEAKLKKESYYNALFFPVPLGDVKIVLETRDNLNRWESEFVDTLFVHDYFTLNEMPSPFVIDTIQYSGNSAHKIDLVFLAEGYRSDQMEKFVKDVRRMSDTLFNVAPFDRYRYRFNVFAIEVPSVESGTDLSGENVFKNTAFNSNFYTFDSPRYLTTRDMKSVYDALDAVGWDQIYMLVNHDRYGGGGFYNFLSVCSSDNEYSSFVFCHEFGHAFAGLGDEYYDSSTAYDDYQDLKIEPWEPNLTTMVDVGVKWQSLIEKDTPVPTPRDSIFKDKVGVYEGGGYVAKGVYSPMMTCWMKERVAGQFCPVCQKAIETMILTQTK